MDAAMAQQNDRRAETLNGRVGQKKLAWIKH
jgi:hypothetical protein